MAEYQRLETRELDFLKCAGIQTTAGRYGGVTHSMRLSDPPAPSPNCVKSRLIYSPVPQEPAGDEQHGGQNFPPTSTFAAVFFYCRDLVFMLAKQTFFFYLPSLLQRCQTHTTRTCTHAHLKAIRQTLHCANKVCSAR